VEIDLKEIRGQCGCFDDEDGCDLDFDSECPYHTECELDFVEDEEDDE